MTIPNIPVLPNWAPGSHHYKVRAVVTMGIGIAYTVFAVATTIMLVAISRYRRSGLGKQSVKLLLFQSLGCYLVALDGLITMAAYDWACYGKLWLFNMGFVMSLGAMSARAFHLFVTYRAHDLTSRLAACNAAAASGAAVDSGVQSRRRLTFSALESPGGLEGLRGEVQRASAYRRLDQQLRKHRKFQRLASDGAQLAYMAAALAVAAVLTGIINATDKQFAVHPVNIYCHLQWGFIPGLAIIGVYFFVVFPLILWRLRRYNDAYGIRNDLIVCGTIGSAIMIVLVVFNTRLLKFQQILPGFFFLWLYALLIHTSSVFVPLVHAIVHMRRTGAADDGPSNGLGLSTQRADFDRMLDDPDEYTRFRSFAAACLCSELTSFIEEYQILKARVLALLEFDETRSTGGPHQQQSKEKEAEASTQATRLSLLIVNAILSQEMDYAQTFARSTTSASTSILDSVVQRYPHIDQVALVFPQQLTPKIAALYRDFADPVSLTSVNASILVVRRISQCIGSNNLHISLFDELKDEVLLMLYCDVYMRYVKKNAGV